MTERAIAEIAGKNIDLIQTPTEDKKSPNIAIRLHLQFYWSAHPPDHTFWLRKKLECPVRNSNPSLI